ncbi:MAG TPA: ATP-binding protein [Candidatus Bathyarchaeia archaeon]|nr:ATP-binding protein [Candidatus Bathyarchaeia archaeon]
MFKSARIKLTGWYLLIIMLVSLLFSGIIYTAISKELERGFRQAEMHFRMGEPAIPLFRQSWRLENASPQLIEELELAKKRLVLNLLSINGAILGFSAIAGYLLAGKTLQPIETVLEEQKRFVADASHELRTPLTALKTAIEVTLREKDISPKEARSVLKSNLEDVNNLENLANNLLNLAQYQDNGHNLIFQDVNIAAVVRNAYRKILPLAKKKNIKIKLEVEKQAVFANQDSLEKMLVNFLDNAIKYTPEGGKVSITAKQGKKNLVIKIKDSGVGIPKKDLSHIFDRFYRAEQSRSKDKISGFGLGLSLAKRIIEIHKGSVSVASTLGKGTAFTVKLPFRHS